MEGTPTCSGSSSGSGVSSVPEGELKLVRPLMCSCQRIFLTLKSFNQHLVDMETEDDEGHCDSSPPQFATHNLSIRPGPKSSKMKSIMKQLAKAAEEFECRQHNLASQHLEALQKFKLESCKAKNKKRRKKKSASKGTSSSKKSASLPKKENLRIKRASMHLLPKAPEMANASHGEPEMTNATPKTKLKPSVILRNPFHGSDGHEDRSPEAIVAARSLTDHNYSKSIISAFDELSCSKVSSDADGEVKKKKRRGRMPNLKKVFEGNKKMNICGPPFTLQQLIALEHNYAN